MEVTALGNKKPVYANQECDRTIKAVRDAMYLLEGKWKIPIISVLCFSRKRYSDILRGVDGISGKMLSRELKELEMNKLVKRIVSESSPVVVEYELTEYGCNFRQVVDQLAAWGIAHREAILHT
ncbi:MAG: transcriptional regulator [Cytophagaceae bacterium]|nr:MAG: transcriptional regulator [Cytophagaceae bacterium]